MHAIASFTLLAIAGSALAAPVGPGNFWGHAEEGLRAVATATETATAYTTVTAGNFAQGAAPTTSSVASVVATTTPAPAPSSSHFFFQPQQNTYSYQAPAATTPAVQQPASTPASSNSGSGSGSDTGYMAVVNEWRSKMGLSTLTQSSTLEANALKTVQDGNGEMKHELNPGSMAQVLAPGDANNFENVFVGGWLCEMPSASGMDGICGTMSAGWDYEGQTGHATILRNAGYSKIGCAIAHGIWGCDLA